MWGFTIDDALISIRYARHLASGAGYRFNASGPSTDGVTPLPWAFVLAPLARGDALDVLFRAKLLGLTAWLAAAGAWGVAVGRVAASGWVKGVAFAALALCVPVAAHAVSGMETGIVIALTTWASLSLDHPMRAAALAGVVAAFRPEMAPWAIALSILNRPGRTVLLAILPLVLCGVTRAIAFGHAAPLSLSAKPSDASHGAMYVAAAALVTLAPVLAFAPIALRRAPRPAIVLTVAGVVHMLAVLIVGGDWMPYARLVAPIAPSLLYAFVLAAPHARPFATIARAALTFALGAYVLVVAAPAGRPIASNYRALIDAARPHLAGARRIASLDIGWPTAANDDATIVDLAGLTDPFIAALPGGHTSKRVDPALLLSRDPDVLLVFAEEGVTAETLATWRDAAYARTVDLRLVRSDLIARHYEARAFLPFGAKNAGYVLLGRRSQPLDPASTQEN